MPAECLSGLPLPILYSQLPAHLSRTPARRKEGGAASAQTESGGHPQQCTEQRSREGAPTHTCLTARTLFTCAHLWLLAHLCSASSLTHPYTSVQYLILCSHLPHLCTPAFPRPPFLPHLWPIHSLPSCLTYSHLPHLPSLSTPTCPFLLELTRARPISLRTPASLTHLCSPASVTHNCAHLPSTNHLPCLTCAHLLHLCTPAFPSSLGPHPLTGLLRAQRSPVFRALSSVPCLLGLGPPHPFLDVCPPGLSHPVLRAR